MFQCEFYLRIKDFICCAFCQRKDLNIHSYTICQIKGNPKYIHRKYVTALRPLNYYLLNGDVVEMLKTIYSDSSKKELMGSDSIMEDFFGTAREGRAVLERMDQEEWDIIGAEMEE